MGAPLENGRNWFDDAVYGRGIQSFRRRDLRYMTRLGLNKLRAVVSDLRVGDTTSATGENGVPATSFTSCCGVKTLGA
jgi:hypothetical protein